MANTNELLAQIKAELDKPKTGPWKNTGIAATGTVSDAVDLGDHYAFIQVIIPTITSAQLELQVSDELNGTYQDKGQDALTKAGTGAYTDTWGLGGWRYIKIKSSAAQDPAVVFQVRGVTDSGGGADGGVGGVDILSIAAGDNNIGNVDIASAIPAGTNAIGKLAANSGVDIGDVDILSIAAGTNAIGKLAANSGVDIGDVDVLTEPSGSGAYTTPTHTAPTAGVATGEMLASNASRLYALLINDSDTVIYVKLGAAAVLNQGIRLNASGGSYEMSKKLGNLYTGAINGISSAASKVLLVTEGV